jgi:DNA-binding NtrC family response regulator
MPRLPSACTAVHLPPQWRAGLSELPTIVRCLVGHTVEEVERELVVTSLDHYHGSRTYTANVFGISIRCLRNKTNQYAALGIAVPAPGLRKEKPTDRAH